MICDKAWKAGWAINSLSLLDWPQNRWHLFFDEIGADDFSIHPAFERPGDDAIRTDYMHNSAPSREGVAINGVHERL